LLDWLYTAISWVMLRWHDLFVTIGLPKDGGLSWALSIMFLVITLRILMFRFFVKQVKTQRAMQELQPKIQAIRQKYKDDRQTMSREIMALQQEAGVNMLAGCLPILLQAPVFISLFHVLKYISPSHDAKYSWTTEQMISAGKARLFGAPIAVGFNSDPGRLAELGGNQAATRIVALILIVCMVVATYLTQRMIMNRSTTQADPQQQMIQKLMLYGMPASLAVSGFFFPIGILVYWFTNNLWTLGQQFYILRKMPMKTATGAEKAPRVENKALAPKPGAKPLHPKNRRSQLIAGADAQPAGDTERLTANGSAGASDPAGTAAKPAAKGTPAKSGPAKSAPAKSAPAKATGKTPPAKAAGTAKGTGKAKTTGTNVASGTAGDAAAGTAAASTGRAAGRKPSAAGKPAAATKPNATGAAATGGSANAGSAEGAGEGTASEGAGAQSGSPNGAKPTPAKSSGNRSSASRKRRR
jgi:YidC/Oxa1 family membrane protein insertase